jgi:hypothetical protein
MKKSFLLIIILFTIVLHTSCASRKVNIEKINVNKDSVVRTETKVSKIENKQKKDSTNIKINTFISEFVLTPIDTSKPVVINNVSYKNAVLGIKKTNSNATYFNVKKESDIKSKDSVSTTEIKKSEEVFTKTKETEKNQNYNTFIWLLILILIFYLLWRNRMSILKKL